MLRASHRVLKPGGVLSFLVIALPEGAEAGMLPRPVDFGPDWVDAGDGYAALTREAGFVEVEIEDLTGEYLVTLEGWIQGWELAAEELSQLLGVEEYRERQAERIRSRAAIREGVLRRYLITAVK